MREKSPNWGGRKMVNKEGEELQNVQDRMTEKSSSCEMLRRRGRRQSSESSDHAAVVTAPQLL